MNRNRKLQLVPQIYIDWAMNFGRKIVAWYEKNPHSLSRSVSGDWGAEKDPEKQARAKIGEAAVALYDELDPALVVKWNIGDGGDRGRDLILRNNMCVDVKTTFPNYKLIWSKAVNHLYWHESKRFDALVAVSVRETDYSKCWIEGWISKQDFYDYKEVSNGVNSGLDVGTWFIDKENLHNIDLLIPKLKQADLFVQPEEKPFEHYCQCGKWGSFGFNVSLLKGQEGQWFCFEHRPTS